MNAMNCGMWKQLREMKVEIGGSRCSWADDETEKVSQIVEKCKNVKWEIVVEDLGSDTGSIHSGEA
jgi:hypothetical protein